MAKRTARLRANAGCHRGAKVVAGATDSVAAFLAAGVREPGVAVTSLGTTLALKVLADQPVEDAARGIYSHRIGDLWLPGGASNVGGGALLQHFSREELAALSARIDPAWEPRHPETYPLPRTGERFPRNDPAMEAVLPPRDDDPRFLFELLHAIARIEREGYEALRSLGAPYPSRVLFRRRRGAQPGLDDHPRARARHPRRSAGARGCRLRHGPPRPRRLDPQLNQPALYPLARYGRSRQPPHRHLAPQTSRARTRP